MCYQLIKEHGYATVEKPWGKEIWFGMTEEYLGKILTLGPGQATSYHVHRQKDETIYVAKGFLKIRIGKSDKVLFCDSVFEEIKEGCAIRIKPGTPHMLVAGSNGAILFEVSLPFIVDTERLEDPFNNRTCVKDIIEEG